MNSIVTKVLAGLSLVLAAIVGVLRIKSLKQNLKEANQEADIAVNNAELTADAAKSINKIGEETGEKIRKRRANRDSFNNDGVRK